MRFKEWDDYLDSMLRHVKFQPDRKKIRQEFGEHMEDMFDDYVSFGMPEDEAKAAVIDNLGDSHEVGKLMNKAHNAVIGWIWQVLKVCLVITIIFSISPMAALMKEVGLGLINMVNGYNDIYYYGDPIYVIELDETVVIDNHTLKFDKLAKYNIQGTNQFILFYRDYKKILDGTISTDYYFELDDDAFTDDQGRGPYDAGGYNGNNGFVNYINEYVVGVPDDAKTLIIEYKGNEKYYKGRYFRIEIDLPENRG